MINGFQLFSAAFQLLVFIDYQSYLTKLDVVVFDLFCLCFSFLSDSINWHLLKLSDEVAQSNTL